MEANRAAGQRAGYLYGTQTANIYRCGIGTAAHSPPLKK